MVDTLDADKLSNQLKLRNASVVANASLDGGDYISTGVRAIPQFFFGYLLPFPALQLLLIVLAIYKFQEAAQKRQQESLLTDGFILSFYALSKKDQEKDSVAKDAIERLKNRSKESLARVEALAAFAKTNAEAINDLPTEQPPSHQATQTSDSTALAVLPYWSFAYTAILQYAVAHWVLWMMIILAKCSALGDFSATGKSADSDPKDFTPMFNDPTLFWVEFLLPAALVLGVWIFNIRRNYTELALSEKEQSEKLEKRQSQIAAYYRNELKKPEARPNSVVSNTNSVEHVTVTAAISSASNPPNTKDISESPITENRTLWLTRATNFLDAFLVLNLFAWPLTMCLQANPFGGHDGVDYTDRAPLDEDYRIPIIFGVSFVLSVIHAYLKGHEMSEETRTLLGNENENPNPSYKQNQGIFAFYTQNPATTTTRMTLCGFHIANLPFRFPLTAFYWFISRFTGSGGILLTRTLFDGGIGGWGLKQTDGHETSSSMDRLDMFAIALGFAVVATLLNLTQVYFAEQRKIALNIKRDDIADGQDNAKSYISRSHSPS